MSDFPEMSLDPPESKILAYCRGCGQEIYLGQKHFEHEGNRVCCECLDDHVAKIFGIGYSDGLE